MKINYSIGDIFIYENRRFTVVDFLRNNHVKGLQAGTTNHYVVVKMNKIKWLSCHKDSRGSHHFALPNEKESFEFIELLKKHKCKNVQVIVKGRSRTKEQGSHSLSKCEWLAVYIEKINSKEQVDYKNQNDQLIETIRQLVKKINENNNLPFYKRKKIEI